MNIAGQSTLTTATATRERTASPSDGSRTVTIDETPETTPRGTPDQVGVLRLRGDMSVRRPPVVRWDDDVIDNEHLGKKKSKVCCIYHKPREVGESSDSESSSSSSDDSDHSCHGGSDGAGRHGKETCRGHARHRRRNKKDPRQVSPNAYERQPVYKNRPQPPPSTGH